MLRKIIYYKNTFNYKIIFFFSDNRKYEIIDLFILHDALSVLGSYLGLAAKKSLDVSKKNIVIKMTIALF